MRFRDQLKIGHDAELALSRWMQMRRWTVFRAVDSDYAPRLDGLTLPDLLAFTEKGLIWIEVKRYETAPTNNTRGCRVHGIVQRHYRDYLEVQNRTGIRVGLLIWQQDTGELLWQWVEQLQVFPCQRRHEHSGSCLVYFDRDRMTVVGNLGRLKEAA